MSEKLDYRGFVVVFVSVISRVIFCVKCDFSAFGLIYTHSWAQFHPKKTYKHIYNITEALANIFGVIFDVICNFRCNFLCKCVF